MVGLRSRAKRPDVGGQIVLLFGPFDRSGAFRAPYKPSNGVFVEVILSDMFDTAYRDVFD